MCSKLCYAVGGAPYQITGCAIGFFLQIYLLDVAQVRPGPGWGGHGAPGAALPGKRALPVRPAGGCVVAVLRGCRSEGCGFPPGPVWPLRCPGPRNGLMMSVGRDTASVSYEHVPGGCEIGKKKRPWGTSCWQWGGVWGGLL